MGFELGYRTLHWQIDFQFKLVVHGVIDLSYRILGVLLFPRDRKDCEMGCFRSFAELKIH